MDQWELAAEAFYQAVLKRPDFADAWAYLGEARQHTSLPGLASSDGQRQESDGFSELQTALQLDPGSVAAHTLLAFYWIRQSRFDQALESLGKAVALAPDNPILTSALGEIQASSGDLDGAYDFF